jgi:hydrocephalus-inducing protein
LLLGRRDQKELRLKSNSLIPVGWRIVGTDQLGEEFEVNPTEGVLDPYQECIVTAAFQASKPSVIKRSIKIEIFDIEKISNTTAMDVQIIAEAYDISMELHFSSKNNETLDFGVLKVSEEGKQLCTLKNKGKYEVGYRFTFESKQLADLFSISPQQGVMMPSDKPYNVTVSFKANKELSIKDVPGLKCVWFGMIIFTFIILEPNNGEVTCTQIIKLAARSVYSKYSIMPVRDLNFGSLIHGVKGTRHVVIENLGEFDFKYSISRCIPGATDSKTLKGKLKGQRPTSPGSFRAKVAKNTDTANFGSFIVFPTSGVCQAGQKQQITVELHPDNPGSFEEAASIDISDRSPLENDVLDYRLIGESRVPGINTVDFTSIFEEQTICKRMELFNTQANAYAEEDRVFYFGAYLTGQVAQVRFKISNPFKVPCDVQISTRPRSRTKSEATDFAFDVGLFLI